MKKVVNTFGKVWHTWDTQKHDLPLGIPALMMGFTGEGQLKPEMLADRDRRFGISTSKLKHNRRDIHMPELISGANFWESGRTCQLQTQDKPMSALGPHKVSSK